MDGRDKQARVAGGLYVAASIPGFFSLIYVPNAIIVTGDPAATMANVVAHETLFRIGIAAELIGAVMWMLVVRALWRLFADVDRGAAWWMAVLGVMATPIMILNTLSEFTVLAMLDDPRFVGAFAPTALQELVRAAMRTHGAGFTIAGVFWGLWLFPFALLVWRSRFLPRALAVILAAAGCGYLVRTFVATLAPHWSDAVEPFAGVTTAGELPVMFWLLLVGARPKTAVATPAPAPL
jgi:hypothetical protein